MSWLVKRKPSDGIATLGQLFIDGAFECYTLEPANPISAGTYDLTIDLSVRFKRLMPHVNNVPGHTGIRIHWGNWAKDTEDCTLVGSIESADFVGHSIDEFDRLFKRLQDTLTMGPVTITYTEEGVVTT